MNHKPATVQTSLLRNLAKRTFLCDYTPIMDNCPKRRRVDLSLLNKLKIINQAHPKLNQTELSTRFGCLQSVISKILSRKNESKKMAAVILTK